MIQERLTEARNLGRSIGGFAAITPSWTAEQVRAVWSAIRSAFPPRSVVVPTQGFLQAFGLPDCYRKRPRVPRFFAGF
jgi:hypothetical protein